MVSAGKDGKSWKERAAPMEKDMDTTKKNDSKRQLCVNYFLFRQVQYYEGKLLNGIVI